MTGAGGPTASPPRQAMLTADGDSVAPGILPDEQRPPRHTESLGGRTVGHTVILRFAVSTQVGTAGGEVGTR